MTKRAVDVSRMLAAARQADPTAVESLLSAYRNYLRLLAGMWIDRSLRGKADASDLVQETLLKAHQHFQQFRGLSEQEFVVWLRQILARNLADLVRRYTAAGRRATREQSLEQAIDQSADALERFLATDASSPSRAAQRREMGVLLADAMAELRPDHREVLVLRSLEQLDWDEVASRLGRSVGAVRMLWTRALKDLRPYLEARMRKEGD